MSDAFRRLDGRQLDAWDWSSTTMLFVSYGWDPAHDGAETLAARRLVKALISCGAHIHVLATNRADDEFCDERYTVTVVPAQQSAGTRIGRALEMMRSTIPETEGTWVSDAVTIGCRMLASMPADTVIYGRAMPGTSNIVAWHLMRLTGRPWVAHFSDEWPPVQVLANGRKWLAPYKWPLFQLWRQRILRDAGALTFTNPSQASQMAGSSGARHLAKSFVVAHLGSEVTPRNQEPQSESFHIVHTGNFYPPGHSAGAVIQGLRVFLDRTPSARALCRFTQAGWSNGDMPHWTDRCGLRDVVRFVGRLPQHDVIALLDTASLLVGVDYARPDSCTVLSKLPDYINARRPILVIAAPLSAMGRLFGEDHVGLTAHYHSPEQVAERIGMVFQAWQQRQSTAFLPSPTAIASFTRRRVLAELAGAFEAARRAVARPKNLPVGDLRRTSRDDSRTLTRSELPGADQLAVETNAGAAS